MGADRPLNVLFISPFYDDRLDDPIEALDRFPILRELPAQLHARGHRVRVLGLAPRAASHAAGGVRYRWLAPSRPVQIVGRAADRFWPHYGSAYYQPSLAIARLARSLDPDILHVFGLTMDPQLALLSLLAGSRSHLVVHYHGGEPSTGHLRKQLQRLATRNIDAALFTSLVQASPWIAAGLLSEGQVHQIPETSSPFGVVDRDAAREITGMTGNPVYLSVGRLHPIKDPLTMLAGFARIAESQPEARLYLYYLTDELIDEAAAFTRSMPIIRDRVEFRGRAEPGQMEAIYSSADVLLQASIREWSGLAVLEAMSCGCVPVVSDIPSFRAMTSGGHYGRLFESGNPWQLAGVALSINDHREMSRLVRGHFERELSFPAMARELERIYRDLSTSP